MILTESLMFLVEFINFLLNIMILAILFKTFLLEDNKEKKETIHRTDSTTTSSQTVYEAREK